MTDDNSLSEKITELRKIPEREPTNLSFPEDETLKI